MTTIASTPAPVKSAEAYWPTYDEPLYDMMARHLFRAGWCTTYVEDLLHHYDRFGTLHDFGGLLDDPDAEDDVVSLQALLEDYLDPHPSPEEWDSRAARAMAEAAYEAGYPLF